MAAKATSAVRPTACVGAAVATVVVAVAAVTALGLAAGISSYNSMTAFLITTSLRSFTLASKMMRVSDSFHIFVTSVSPGKTFLAKRTLMLLNRRPSLLANAL